MHVSSVRNRIDKVNAKLNVKSGQPVRHRL